MPRGIYRKMTIRDWSVLELQVKEEVSEYMILLVPLCGFGSRGRDSKMSSVGGKRIYGLAELFNK